MNRSEVVAAIANKDELDPATVRKVVDSLLEVVRLSVTLGEEVTLRGFGRFEPKSMTTTVRRVPRTGELVQVPARASVRFIPSGTFRERLDARNGHG